MKDNMELIKLKTFGLISKNKSLNLSWYEAINKFVVPKGWGNVSEEQIKQISLNLNKDLTQSQKNLASIVLHNVDSDFNYNIDFENDIEKWECNIENSPDSFSETTKEIKDIIKSELFLNIHKRLFVKFLTPAIEILNEYIIPKVKAGEMIDINELALQSFLDVINNSKLIDNFKRIKI